MDVTRAAAAAQLSRSLAGCVRLAALAACIMEPGDPSRLQLQQCAKWAARAKRHADAAIFLDDVDALRSTH